MSVLFIAPLISSIYLYGIGYLYGNKTTQSNIPNEETLKKMFSSSRCNW